MSHPSPMSTSPVPAAAVAARLILICAVVTLGPIACGDASDSGPAATPGSEAPATPQSAPPSAKAPTPARPGLPEVDPGVPSSLPDDVPVPEGATAYHPPMEDMGAIRAAFRIDDDTASVRGWYQQALSEGSWTLAQEREIGADVLMAAQKEHRQLTIAITDGGDFTNLMLVHADGS